MMKSLLLPWMRKDPPIATGPKADHYKIVRYPLPNRHPDHSSEKPAEESSEYD
jgi:hypothetical protein